MIEASAITEHLAGLAAERAAAIREIFLRALQEREEFRKLYLLFLEENERLKQGLLGQKSERFLREDGQITFEQVLQMMFGGDAAAPTTAEPAARELQTIPEHARRKPVRKPPPEDLPRIEIQVVSEEVKRAGLDAYEVIGVTTTESMERRKASTVVVRIVRPKFVRKDGPQQGEPVVLQAEPPDHPIPRASVGPGFLAETVVRRFEDHMPLHRQEKMFAREGLDISRSTICGWHAELAVLCAPVVAAMRTDALAQPYLCTDATGVLVQAKKKCRTGHFWVLVAPGLHVLFEYSPKHDGAAVDRLLGGFGGTLVADAHTVYDHLYADGSILEAGCWSHARRYGFKALRSDPERAKTVLTIIGGLFLIEREIHDASLEERSRVRRERSAPLVDKYFAWCEEQAPLVLDDTPIANGIRYALNQRKALSRFLEDPRLPIHNNASELHLRRQVIGRRNWLFLGSDDAGPVNTTFVSLLASCGLHKLNSWDYLLDIFCLLPRWPKSRVLELAPAYWKKTAEDEEVQRRLAANPYRAVALGLEPKPP